MNSTEILEKHPKSKNVIKNWFIQEMMSSMNDSTVPASFKKYMINQGIEDSKIARLIDLNPRMLFDVFDKNNIIILITYTPNFGFSYYINEHQKEQIYNTRREAEHNAIVKAFEMLELNLNK